MQAKIRSNGFNYIALIGSSIYEIPIVWFRIKISSDYMHKMVVKRKLVWGYFKIFGK